MVQRVMVAVISIPLLLWMIYGVSPGWPIVLPIAIAVISMLAVHEALWSTSFLKHPRISGYSILLAGLIPFWVFYDGQALPALWGLFLYVILLFSEAIASRGRIGLEKMGGAFFLSVFVPFFLSSFLRIRLMVYRPVRRGPAPAVSVSGGLPASGPLWRLGQCGVSAGGFVLFLHQAGVWHQGLWQPPAGAWGDFGPV